MATTEERLAGLAQRRSRPAAPAAAGPDGTAPLPAPPRRGRRSSAAPLTRVLVTGASVSAVLAGAGFLALADQAVSATAPSAPQGAGASPTAALAGGAPTLPIQVVVVTRQVPAAAPAAAAAPVAPSAPAPQASPLGAAAPKAAVVAAPPVAAPPVAAPPAAPPVAPPPAAPPAPVTTTKPS